MNFFLFAFIGSAPLTTDVIAPQWDSPGVLLLKLAAIAALVGLNAFFVACEFAIVKVRSSQLDALVEEGNLRASFVKHVRAHLDAYLSATQLGVTVASLALGWVGEQCLASILQPAFALVHFYSRALVTPVSFGLAFAAFPLWLSVLGEWAQKKSGTRIPSPLRPRLALP